MVAPGIVEVQRSLGSRRRIAAKAEILSHHNVIGKPHPKDQHATLSGS
jgi:hypothetical protein